MSLDEYNRHSTLGPMAGPATSAAAAAGQAAHRQRHESSQIDDPAPKPTLGGSIRVLVFLAFVFAGALASLLLLPDDSTGATVAAFAALVSGLGFVIFGVIMGLEALKYALSWTIASAIEHGWWRMVVVALAAFIFAALHADTLGPVTGWMVALFAVALSLAARFAPALRSACIALGAGTITYILAASYVFERSALLALITGVLVAAMIFGVARILQGRRSRASTV